MKYQCKKCPFKVESRSFKKAMSVLRRHYDRKHGGFDRKKTKGARGKVSKLGKLVAKVEGLLSDLKNAT